MPRTKQKPAQPVAAQPIRTEPPQPTSKELREARIKRQFEAVEELAQVFIKDITSVHFELLKTFKLILDRSRGCTTPVEEFIESLVMRYGWRDDEGKGLTIEDVEREMADLRSADLAGEIEQAHFMANRYPLPEPQG